MKEKCIKCGGEGWLWWFELDEYTGPGNDPYDCNTDDNKYTCDLCGGSGESRILEDVE